MKSNYEDSMKDMLILENQRHFFAIKKSPLENTRGDSKSLYQAGDGAS
jgi:hypothetical protein